MSRLSSGPAAPPSNFARYLPGPGHALNDLELAPHRHILGIKSAKMSFFPKSSWRRRMPQLQRCMQLCFPPSWLLGGKATSQLLYTFRKNDRIDTRQGSSSLFRSWRLRVPKRIFACARSLASCSRKQSLSSRRLQRTETISSFAVQYDTNIIAV